MKKEGFSNDKNTDKSLYKFPIVAIGASAGGLDALKKFFSNMPPEPGMAFVVVQHLDPTHKSNMVHLLNKYTSLKVYQALDGMGVKPDHVYIIPPNRDMGIMNGSIQLMEPTEPHGLRLPINYFFKNLADDQKDKSIAIIFSGFGSDGTLGLRAVKAMGGMIMSQDPKTADSDSMPKSAIQTGLVDFILPPEKMPEKLISYVNASYKPIKKFLAPKEEAEQYLQKVFMLIRTQTGHDFSYYKRNTINRRIERRMNIHQIENIELYLDYLQDNPHEIDTLFKELLINVTSFFRDQKAWKSLKKSLKELINQKSDMDNLRVWVPGCSTGEEVYSIAITISELIEESGKNLYVQIFGTDIDNDAIKDARSGSYTISIDSNISKERLEKYFVKKDGNFIIRNDIREMAVFAPHDLIKDPPFTNIDFLSCRNLLIYLNGDAQKKALSNFNYALNSDGILFLGPSESVGDFVDAFSVVDSKWKVFKCIKSTKLMHKYLEFHPIIHKIPNPNIEPRLLFKNLKKDSNVNIANKVEKKLFDIYVPPSAIITDYGEILYIHGRLGNYLEPAQGEAKLNINEMAREGLKFELRSAIQNASITKKEVIVEGLRVKNNGGHVFVTLTVKPMDLETDGGLLLISFEDNKSKEDFKEDKIKLDMVIKGDEKILELENELRMTKERLNTTIEEMKSSNEELQSMNEEAQSTNEELETSKEELQSINEEMVTINNELNLKIDELNQTQDDMNNLFNSAEIATIFLDRNLKIRRFTKEATKLIKMIQSDIGRPLSDISTTFKYDKLIEDIRQVLEKVIYKDIDIETENGEWFETKIIPYKTSKNVIDGVVITFTNITKSKKQIIDTKQLIDWVIQTAHDPLLVLDNNMRVFSANQSFYETYNVTQEETLGNVFYDLGENQWNIQTLKNLLEEVLPKNIKIDNFMVEANFPKIGFRKISLNARQILQNGEQMILIGLKDIPDDKEH
jgi:two-component system CheB/CheR fusion protein